MCIEKVQIDHFMVIVLTLKIMITFTPGIFSTTSYKNLKVANNTFNCYKVLFK